MAVVAFGGGPATAERLAIQVPEDWSLSAEPIVRIGVLSGDDAYQLHDVESSALLPDGGIVVLNGGSGQVRLFDRAGTFLRQFGGRGEGPGEFLLATRIARSGDTLTVWDQRQRRFTRFDDRGTLLNTETIPMDPAEPFPLDVWLYGRNLVDSPVEPAVRGTLAAGIDALPPVREDIGVRFVMVTEEGHLWVADAVPPVERDLTWTIHDLDGSPRARIRTPARFRPHEIGPDYVLGLWLDDLDVNYVRMYRLVRPEGSAPGPGLEAVRRSGTPLPVRAPDDLPDDVLPTLRSSLKFLASAQEIHYSHNYTYTMDLSDTELEVPAELRVDFIEGHARGWTGFITHRPTGAFCVLTYGYTATMGWPNGAVVCPGG
jgi:hypothetical protein